MGSRKTSVDRYETPPELLLAIVLRTLDALPRDRRASAIRATAEHYKGIHAGAPLPKWVQMLAEVADRGSDA